MNCLRGSGWRKMRRSLRGAIPVDREAKPRGPSFLLRLREIEHALEWTNASLTMSAEVHHAFTLSAEWLLDNAYLIREQVIDLRESLPQEYFGELPLIGTGPEAGLPRVYQVASEMVAETGGALEAEIIRKFLVAFQASRAAGHRRTLGPPADVAIAVARTSAHARDPGRATAKPERGGRLLGESADHRGRGMVRRSCLR